MKKPDRQSIIRWMRAFHDCGCISVSFDDVTIDLLRDGGLIAGGPNAWRLTEAGQRIADAAAAEGFR